MDFNKPPTARQQLLLIDKIYKTDEQLTETLTEHGYQSHKKVHVPKVSCFTYLPTSFPKNKTEAENFNFEAIRGQKVTLGVCIGGTCLSNGWDEKTKLGVRGILKINNNCTAADKAATQIFIAVDDFYKEFKDEITEYDVQLDVRVCGYSLGALFAQVTTVLLQDWAHSTGSTVTCRTFESPGVPEMYHEISKNYDIDPEKFWKERIVNYKSLPNPLNTVFQDIGRVVHLKNTDHIEWNGSWVVKCLAGTTKRVMFWSSLLNGFGVNNGENAFDQMSKFEKKCIIGASIAMELGMDLPEIVRNHDVATMLKSFDEKTGYWRPGVCIEMDGWPVYDHFEEFAIKLMQKMSQGFLPFNPRNAGVHTLLFFGGKKGFVERKLTSIPGYLPMKQNAVEVKTGVVKE